MIYSGACTQSHDVMAFDWVISTEDGPQAVAPHSFSYCYTVMLCASN